MEKKQMTPAMRSALISKIQKNAAQNPDYKKHVEKKIQEFKDNQNKSNRYKIMKKNEVIVLSIVVGVIFASLFGYYFGENIFTSTVR